MSRLIYAHVFVVFWWITNLIDFDIRGFSLPSSSLPSLVLWLHTHDHGKTEKIMMNTWRLHRSDPSYERNDSMTVPSSAHCVIIVLQLSSDCLWCLLPDRRRESRLTAALCQTGKAIKSIHHRARARNHQMRPLPPSNNFVVKLSIRVWWEISTAQSSVSCDDDNARAHSQREFPILISPFMLSLWSHDHFHQLLLLPRFVLYNFFFLQVARVSSGVERNNKSYIIFREYEIRRRASALGSSCCPCLVGHGNF